MSSDVTTETFRNSDRIIAGSAFFVRTPNRGYVRATTVNDQQGNHNRNIP